MDILIDDVRLSSPVPADATVADVIALAKDQLDPQQSIIVGVRREGELVASNEIEAVLDQRVDRIDRLELLTGDPRAIVLETLTQSQLAFEQTFHEVTRVADQLADGSVADAMARLLDCVAAWSGVHQAIMQGGALLDIDFENLVIESRPLIDWMSDLAARLQDIKSAIANQDHVLLADILRYEIDETLRAWQRFLAGFVQYVRSGVE